MAFSSILNPVLNWVLLFSPLTGLIILSFLVNLLITLMYKYTTDQKLMKDLKTEIKELQKEMKSLRKDPKKMMEVQKKSMETNMKYMSKSMKATLYTFIPIIIIFAWMNAHLAYAPLMPNQEFSVEVFLENAMVGENVTLTSVPELDIVSGPVSKIKNNRAEWTLKGDPGEYTLEFEYDGEKARKDILITDKKEYLPPVEKLKKGKIKQIVIGNKEIKPLGDASIFGWKPGWLGTYIILSILFSIIIRKVMKVY